MSIDIGLENLSDTSKQDVVLFEPIDLIEDRMELCNLNSAIQNLFIELNQKCDSLENLLTISEHIEKHGSSEALIDLVGEKFSTEGAVIEGVKKVIKWIITQIQKLLALIARGLNKLAGTQAKVKTVEKIVTKIKEVPVEVIKEKEVVKTIEVAVEKPVYVAKNEQWKFDTDILGESKSMMELTKVVLSMRYGDSGSVPATLKEFVSKYDSFVANSDFDKDYFGKFKKETILTTTQLVEVAENCNKVVNETNKGLYDAQRKLENASVYYKSLKAETGVDEKELASAKENMQMWYKVTKFGFYLIDHASFICGFLTKEFMGGSRLYTDK